MTVVTYKANHDTYINQAAKTTNYGTGDSVLVSGYSGNVKKGLVSWDLSAASASKLVGGKLRLYVNTNTGGTITVTIYRLLKAFGENTATWIKASASAGSVTVSYNHRLNSEENHLNAAETLANKFGWLENATLHAGGMPDSSGNVYVMIHKGEAMSLLDFFEYNEKKV